MIGLALSKCEFWFVGEIVIGCSIQYDKDFAIISLSSDGDSEMDEELNLEACRDANEVKNRLESYFEEHGGKLVPAATKGIELTK